MTVKLPRVLGVVATLLALASGVHAADEPSRMLTSRWGFYAGGYLADLSTDAQLGLGSSLGTFFRLEDDFDYEDSQDVLSFGGYRRFGRRHKVEVSFLQINRSAFGNLSEDIEIIGKTFTADYESEYDMSLYKATYKFSFKNDGRLDAGLTLGLNAFDFGFGVSGEASVTDPNGVVTTGIERVSTDFLAPVPSYGMFVDYAFTPRFGTRMRAEFFNLETGDFEGRYIDTRWTLDYLFTDVFGGGIGVASMDMSFTDLSDDPIKVDYEYNGLIAYLSLFFGESSAGSGSPTP